MPNYELSKDDFALIDEALLTAARARESQSPRISRTFAAYQYRDLAERFRNGFTAFIVPNE